MAQKWGGPKNLTLKDFSGGENSSDSPIVLLPTELSSCQNYVPDERVPLKRRLGLTLFTSASIPLGVAGAIRFYPRDPDAIEDLDPPFVVGVGQGAVATAWVITSENAGSIYAVAYDDATDLQLVRFVQYQDRLYFVGEDPADNNTAPMGVITWDPSGARDLILCKAGVHAPTKSGTLAESAGGNLDALATYKYKIAFGYAANAAYGESNPGPAIEKTLTGTNKTITITFFGADPGSYAYSGWTPASEANVGKVYIYRTLGNGDDYYLLTTVTSGDSYEDSAADSELDDSTVPNTDNYAPPEARHICLLGSQVFVGNLYDGSDYFPNRVRWPLSGYPDIWPAVNYRDVAVQHGQIQGFAILNGAVYVFFESAIGRIVVHSGSEHTFEIVNTEVGVKHPDTLAVGRELDREVAFFWGTDNAVYAFDGFKSRPISDDVKKYLKSNVVDPSANHYRTAVGGWDGEAYHLAWTVDAATDYLQELRYYPRIRKVEPRTGQSSGTWWPQRYSLVVDKYPCGYVRFDGASDNGEFLLIQKDHLYFLDTGNSDNDSAIPYHATTGRMDLGVAHHEKRLNQIAVDAESDTALRVGYYYDWATSETGGFDTTTGSNPARSFGGRMGRMPFRYIQFKFSGEDKDAPSTVYAAHIRFEIEREDRGTRT